MSSEAILSKHEIIELLRLAGREREREYRARHAAARLTPRELEVLRAVAEHLNVTIGAFRKLYAALHASLETLY